MDECMDKWPDDKWTANRQINFWTFPPKEVNGTIDSSPKIIIEEYSIQNENRTFMLTGHRTTGHQRYQ